MGTQFLYLVALPLFPKLFLCHYILKEQTCEKFTRITKPPNPYLHFAKSLSARPPSASYIEELTTIHFTSGIKISLPTLPVLNETRWPQSLAYSTILQMDAVNHPFIITEPVRVLRAHQTPTTPFTLTTIQHKRDPLQIEDLTPLLPHHIYSPYPLMHLPHPL